MSLFGILRMLPMFMSLWQNTTGEFMDLNTVLKRIKIEISNLKFFLNNFYNILELFEFIAEIIT